MSKIYRLLFLLIGLSLTLTACAQPGQSEPTEKVEQLATATSTSSISCPAPEKQPSCSPKGAQPTPNATLEALLPPADEDDWVHGPDDAYVTLIEYGDFQ